MQVQGVEGPAPAQRIGRQVVGTAIGIGDAALACHRNRLRDRLDRQGPEQLVDVLEHARGHVAQAERASVERVDAVTRAAEGGAPPWQQRVLEEELAGRVGHRGEAAVEQAGGGDRDGRRIGAAGPAREVVRAEAVVAHAEEVTQVVHRVRPEHVGRAELDRRACLRQHDAAEPAGQRIELRAARAVVVVGAHHRHAEHRRAHAVGDHVDRALAGAFGPTLRADALERERDVAKGDVLEAPVADRARQPGARAQVDHPDVAPQCAQPAHQVRAHRRMGVGGAARAVAVQQHDRIAPLATRIVERRTRAAQPATRRARERIAGGEPVARQQHLHRLVARAPALAGVERDRREARDAGQRGRQPPPSVEAVAARLVGLAE